MILSFSPDENIFTFHQNDYADEIRISRIYIF